MTNSKPAVQILTPPSSAGSGPKKRNKKGPKRVKKVATKMDLDAEMDAYKAGATAQVGA